MFPFTSSSASGPRYASSQLLCCLHAEPFLFLSMFCRVAPPGWCLWGIAVVVSHCPATEVLTSHCGIQSRLNSDLGQSSRAAPRLCTPALPLCPVPAFLPSLTLSLPSKGVPHPHLPLAGSHSLCISHIFCDTTDFVPFAITSRVTIV